VPQISQNKSFASAVVILLVYYRPDALHDARPQCQSIYMYMVHNLINVHKEG